MPVGSDMQKVRFHTDSPVKWFGNSRTEALFNERSNLKFEGTSIDVVIDFIFKRWVTVEAYVQRAASDSVYCVRILGVVVT